MVGTGYVGLVSGACFSELGLDVTCVDSDKDKIDTLLDGRLPIYEPGLDRLVTDNVKAGRLHFTNDLSTAVKGAKAIFIAVGTPSRRGDGHADLSYVYAAAEEIAKNADEGAIVVTKSTVPVGTGSQIKKRISVIRNDELEVAANPEFLREGSAINDFMYPDRVIIGVESIRAEGIMNDVYSFLSLNKTPVVMTSLETAEMIKYASNTFLATKITFINEFSDLCEKTGADINDVALGIGLDDRIGRKFLNAGPGFGGSCFPKDTRALVQTARDYKSPITLVEQVISINEQRKMDMVSKIIESCGGSVLSKRITILGLTFKPNTDDVRDAPSLVIIPELIKVGASISVYDPKGMSEAHMYIDNVSWNDDPYSAIDGADGVVILTEWDEFKYLDLDKIKRLVNTPLIIDLRNMFRPDDIFKKGFDYVSIGRSSVYGANKNRL
jgi:UDPglucose 6-dehydrogenase